ncbi:hypothetical protein ACVWYF_002440 [Hymenobacter sp. UYAg731]
MTHLLPFSIRRRGPFLTTAFCLLSAAVAAQPTVTGLTPTRNGQVARAAAVGATFSQPLDARSARALHVFSSQAGGKKAGTATLSGNGLAFAPAAGFKAGETVWATLDTAARDASRQRLTRPQVWQLTAATTPSTGGFSGGSVISVPTDAVSLAMGDVDGDGDIDLLTGHARALSIRLNDGTGEYYSTADIPISNSVRNAKLGDVDGDGDLDLVTLEATVSYTTPGFYTVRRNDSSGSFGSPVSVSGGSVAPDDFVLVDVDGDSDLDLVAQAKLSGVDIRLNNGAGVFSTGPFISAQSLGVAAIAVGDVDGDGDLDVLYSNITNSTVAVRLNNGPATSFATGTSVTGAGTRPSRALHLADVDQDGDLDLLFVADTNGTTYSVAVCLNNGTGVFGASTALAVPSELRDIETRDVDGDGDLDLLVLQLFPAKATIWLNNGAGTFAANPVPSLTLDANAAFIALADIEDDGDADLVVVNDQGDVVLLRNGGNAPAPYAVTAVAPLRNALTAARTSSATATFGTPMSAAAGTTGALRVFSSRTGGRKAGAAAVAGAALSFAPATAFLPGETVNVTVTKAARSAAGIPLARPYVWQFTTAATGTGQFGPSADLSYTGFPYTLRLVDIDGDRDLDMVTSFVMPTGYWSPLLVRRNDGNGTFGAPTPLLGATVGAPFFDLADVDNDGDLDFVGKTYSTVNNLVLANNVYLNDGTGTFAPGGGVANLIEGALTLGDVDGDGDLDVVNGMVRLNDGHGNFYGSAIFHPAVTNFPAPMSGAALADLDNDGDLDFVGSIRSRFIKGFNDGFGNFTTGTDFSPVSNLDDVLLHDLDGDGDADLAIGGSIWFNNGAGEFAAGPVFATGFAVALGDVDGDGDADLVTGGQSGGQLFLNNGRGVFTLGPVLAFGAAYQASFGDLDGDGDLDLVTVRQAPFGWRVTFNGTTTATAVPRAAQLGFATWPSPGPAGGVLHVGLAQQALAATLTLRTLLGQALRTQAFSGTDTTVPTTGLAAGVYLLVVQVTGQPPITQRVVIE